MFPKASQKSAYFRLSGEIPTARVRVRGLVERFWGQIVQTEQNLPAGNTQWTSQAVLES